MTIPTTHSQKNPFDADTNARPIRVCFVTLRAYPLFNSSVNAVFGGAEVDLYLLATELARDARFKVSFIVGDYGQPRIEQRDNVTLIKSLNVNRSYFLYAGKIWNALRRADADIYVQEACSLLTTTIALFCKWHHKRFIYRTASRREAKGDYLRDHPFRGRLVHWAFRTAAVLIAQNEEDRLEFRRFNLESVVIRNVCRLHEMNENRRQYVLWVGRSESVKRPDLLIALARQCPDIPFVMICPRADNDPHYNDLMHEASSLPNLKFIPGVPFDQVDTYFGNALLHVNTSDSEGFPNTFVQACKAATPILSLSVNPDSFLDRYDCGRCANGNWEQFIDLFKALLQPDFAGQLGQHGLDYVRQHHDIRQIIEQYKILFLPAGETNSQSHQKISPG